jgi:predicted acylesterase/phospholipase RssA
MKALHLLALNLTVLSLLNLSTLANADSAKPDICYGMALSDGKGLGPYQAGVISALLENYPSEQVAYQAVSGVNQGALNAHILAQF